MSHKYFPLSLLEFLVLPDDIFRFEGNSHYYGITQLLSAVPDARGLSDDPKESVKLSDPAPLSETGHPEEEHKTAFPTTSDFLSVGTEGTP